MRIVHYARLAPHLFGKLKMEEEGGGGKEKLKKKKCVQLSIPILYNHFLYRNYSYQV